MRGVSIRLRFTQSVHAYEIIEPAEIRRQAMRQIRPKCRYAVPDSQPRTQIVGVAMSPLADPVCLRPQWRSDRARPRHRAADSPGATATRRESPLLMRRQEPDSRDLTTPFQPHDTGVSSSAFVDSSSYPSRSAC